MKRTFLLIIIAFCFRSLSFSQATSLTVDCQTPGWLSYLINYGDQQTLVNLKVTGYINETDLTFIGSLNKNQQLKGVIDLEDVQIVAANNSDNNKLTKSYFSAHIQHLLLPKSLESATKCLSGATLDTLTVGGESLPVIDGTMFYGDGTTNPHGARFNKNVKHLILREGVKEISDGTFYNGHEVHTTSSYNSGAISESVFESIDFPSTLTDIGNFAFENCYKLRNIKLPNSIVSIGEYAFANDTIAFGDTIRLPKELEKLDFNSFSCGYVLSEKYYPYKNYYQYTILNDQVVYIPKDVDTINMVGLTEIRNIVWHIDATNPPSLSISSSWQTGSSLYVQKAKQSITVYVPKSSLETYKRASVWKELTIMAEPIIANGINIEQDSIEIKKGNLAQLNVVVLPEDADDKSYTWSTSNPNVAFVSQDGLVTAISSGEAKIYATLNVDNTIVDTCLVTVYQPVTAVSLNTTVKDVKVGDTFKLVATISPVDADNKKLIWNSTDNEIAEVDADGNVTALKPGIAFIKATSEDNPMAVDSCKVTVTQPVTGITLNYSKFGFNQIGATAQLIATITPDDASNKEVTWHSSNESICFISNGTIVSTGYGSCVVLATTVDGGYLASCIVDVYKLGDVNHDGVISIGDVTTIIDKLLDGTGSEYDSIWADVNADGVVSISDVTELIDQLLNSSN